jgi:hypothetical protein
MTITTTDLPTKVTDLPSTFPTDFLIGVVLFLFVVLFFLLAASRVLGFIVTKLLSKFYGSSEHYIHIGACSFSILGGKLLFRNVKYTTKNTCIRVVEGFLILRWWKGTVKESTADKNEESRAQINLHGFEYLIFNNTARYDNIREIIRKRQENSESGVSDDADAQELVEQVKMTAVEEWEAGWFSKIVPVVDLSIKRGCMMIGNFNVASMLVIDFEKADGVYATEVPPGEARLDYYRNVYDITIKQLRVAAVDNPEFTRIDKETPIKEAKKGFSRLRCIRE